MFVSLVHIAIISMIPTDIFIQKNVYTDMSFVPLPENRFSRIIKVYRLTRSERMSEGSSDLTSLQGILDVHRESYYQRLPSSGHDDRLTGIVQYRFGERVHFVNESFLESFIVRRTVVR